MRRIVYLFMILSLSIIVAACSGNDVENADNLEGSDKSAEEKEMQEGEETSDTEEATSSDSANNNDSASGEGSSENGETSGDEGSSGSDSNSTGSEGSSSEAADSDSSANSGQSESDQGSEDSTEGESGESEEAPSADGHVNGTPRSEEEMSSATQYTFSELEGNAVEVLTGVSAANIQVSNIPEAGQDADVYMMIDDGQIIDMSYDSERETFRNLQIKDVSPQSIKSATVYVSS